MTMGLKALIQRLHARAADTPADTRPDTPDTPAKNMGYQRKPSVIKGCTPDPPDTPSISDTRQQIAKPPAPAPLPAPAASDQDAANDPALYDWHTLDRAYLDHHMQCTQCKTAGRRRGERCATGAALWRSYEDAPIPWRSKGART